MRNVFQCFLAALLLLSAVPPARAEIMEGAEEAFFGEIPRVVGTLTQTDQSKSPVSVTTITEEQIKLTPARNLYDILETYVPGFEYMSHFDGNHMGLRGLIVDRDYEFLLLVNGRLMNQRSHNGAITELENWDMNDIKKVEVIRGPGSVTYGPGAVAGVISITTKDAASSPGTKVGAQSVSGYRSNGAYASTSLKKGDVSSYFYGSFTRTDGYNNPTIYATATPTDAGQSGVVPKPTQTYYNDYRDRPQVKFHAQVDLGKEWTFWGRYTDSGTNRSATWTGFGSFQTDGQQHRTGVRQYVLTAENKHRFSDNLNIESSLSWSSLDNQRIDGASGITGSPTFLDLWLIDGSASAGNFVENYAENDATFKSILRYNPAETWKTAVGVEASYVNLGRGWGSNEDAFIMDDGVTITAFPGSIADQGRSWYGDPSKGLRIYAKNVDMNTSAVLAEVSKSFTPSLEMTLADRIDKYSYTTAAQSPRFSVVYDADTKGLYKFSVQQSIRQNTLLELYIAHHFNLATPKPETFNGAEFSYNNKIKAVNCTATTFYSDVNLLGWNGGANGNAGTTNRTGRLKIAGLELEAEYKSPSEKFTIGGNHTFEKQVGYKRDTNDTTNSYISQSDANFTGAKRPSSSPPRSLSAPISVIVSPASAHPPVVSRSTTTNVISASGVPRSAKRLLATGRVAPRPWARRKARAAAPGAIWAMSREVGATIRGPYIELMFVRTACSIRRRSRSRPDPETPTSAGDPLPGACGNVTRFDVVATRRTRGFHHYTIGGELEIEEETVLEERIEEVSCRWCSATGERIERLESEPVDSEPA